MQHRVWCTQKTIDIHQSVDRVYDYLIHWNHLEEWDLGASAARQLTPGPPAVGTRFGVALRLGWQPITMTYAIVAADPPRLITLEGHAARFHAVDRIRLGQRPFGTRLTYTVEITFDKRRSAWVDAIGRRLFDIYAERTIGRLQAMLGGTPASPPQLTPLTRLADRAILPGLIGFTTLGYTLGKHRRPVASGVYAGRTIVLTGGTSGIGRAVAGQLVRRGARVIVIGRNADKLNSLQAELTGMGLSGEVTTELADLALMVDVREVATRLLRRHGRIDGLINNAGALYNTYQRTAEGIERTMATDLVSPYLLTRLLLPALKASGDARVVNVASGGMYTQAMRADMLAARPTDYDGPTAYARAKRGLVMLTEEWARQWAPFGLSVHAMHPGWVDTPGLQQSLPLFHRQLSPWLRSPEQGADTIVWLAGSPDAHRASGHFWLDRKIRVTHVFRRTAESPGDRFGLIRALDAMAGCAPTE